MADATHFFEGIQSESDATLREATGRGKAEADADWINGEAVVYYIGDPTYWNGFDSETGLNLEQKAGTTCLTYEPSQAYIAAYNNQIKRMIAEQGLPAYSRKPLATLIDAPEQVFGQSLSWNTQETLQLSLNGKPGSVGDRLLQWTTELTNSGEHERQLVTFEFHSGIGELNWITISWIQSPEPHETIEVVHGPPGSDVAFLRVQPLRVGNAKTVSNYATLDLRNGRWLYVENYP
ncbi:MAG: hypothetical protein AAGH88_10890 [Planctomycetota bacterium]